MANASAKIVVEVRIEEVRHRLTDSGGHDLDDSEVQRDFGKLVEHALGRIRDTHTHWYSFLAAVGQKRWSRYRGNQCLASSSIEQT